MSSLAAVQADGYYHPPDFDPKKHKSLNKFRNSHGALGDRARKVDQGILIIRFEMPFHVWCEGCSHLIAQGVRFNAEKKQIGMYHSTKVWSFTMKAPCCGQKIEIHTDPKNTEYLVVHGGRRKVEASIDEMQIIDPEAAAAARADPLARLEAQEEDKRKTTESRLQITAIKEDNDVKHKNDYAQNRRLRAQVRSKRKDEKALDDTRRRLGVSKSVKLLPGNSDDILEASRVRFGVGKDNSAHYTLKKARRSILNQSIFG